MEAVYDARTIWERTDLAGGRQMGESIFIKRASLGPKFVEFATSRQTEMCQSITTDTQLGRQCKNLGQVSSVLLYKVDDTTSRMIHATMK